MAETSQGAGPSSLNWEGDNAVHLASYAVRFGFIDRGGQGKNGAHLGDLEEVHDAAVRSGNDQPEAFGLAMHVLIHHQSHTGRIHVGHFGQVDDGEAWGRAAAQLRL